jgi:hypothetical protein
LVVDTDWNFIKIEAINTALYKKEIYESLDLKGVTTWLDLRNKAAHGKYNLYVQQEVSIMLAGVMNFISKIPA